jgi:hypothetical protein
MIPPTYRRAREGIGPARYEMAVGGGIGGGGASVTSCWQRDLLEDFSAGRVVGPSCHKYAELTHLL